MSSQLSGSQSSDGGETKDDGEEKKATSITFHMHRGIVDPDKGLGFFHLEMPFSEGLSKTKDSGYPRILLVIKDEDQMASLNRMKLLNHHNILAIHFFDKEKDGCIRAYVEPYEGCISDLFTDPKFFADNVTRLVPSQDFQAIVSASLDALDHIIKNNLFHGNFSWDTTVYHQAKDGKKTLKLSNFEERKNKTLLECQLGDCHALAHGLEEVSERVKNFDPRPGAVFLIDDLRLRLAAVTSQTLSTMKLENEDHPFFWDGDRKRSFYGYEIPAVWDTPAFLQSFERSSSAPTLPWDTLWEADDFLTEMKVYRRANRIKKYDFNDMKDFIRFICGLYTHEIELKKKILHRTLDAAVFDKHPRLVLDLKAATQAVATE